MPDQKTNKISETDLILNKDGSLYHLNLLPGEVAETIITVGDPGRVSQISKYFDTVEIKKRKREFVTHTGYIGKKRVTVISTGIGTGNIDIVLNELDALTNIDLETRFPKEIKQSLEIIRIGTSGAIQHEIPVDSLLVSSAAFGLDSLMNYYGQKPDGINQGFLAAFTSAFPASYKLNPYFSLPDKNLLENYAGNLPLGITLTVPGFYAAQGRKLRAKQNMPDLMPIIQNFVFSGNKIANLEMETAGIYGLAASLGHKAISFNIILANRANDIFSKNPAKIMDSRIRQILNIISKPTEIPQIDHRKKFIF